eukprot:gene5689-6573_t
MSQYLVVNEQCLHKASELSKTGQHIPALDAIRDLLLYRNTWHPSLENVMSLYIRLCIDIPAANLKDQIPYIKDGLHQYRASLTSQKEFNSTPLDNILKDLINRAYTKINDITAAHVEPATPVEGEAVSSETPAEPTLEEKLAPSVKLLTEIYQILLDILKHPKLEIIYQKIANQALNFCLKYERKKEFYRLGETLRNHVENLMKGQNQYLTPETIYIHIDVRFTQLNTATTLGLWQEAFKSIEDINTLFGLLAKPKSPILASYYQKLSQIYWVANSHLLHAYALYKHLFYNKTYNTNFSQEDQLLYSSVLLVAAISSPVQESNSGSSLLAFDHQSQRNTNLASLLGLSAYPKREAFLVEVRRMATNVYPELADLASIFERACSPLTLAAQLEPKIRFIESHPALKQYLLPFQRIVFTKIAVQVSKVYEVIKIVEFVKLVPFFDKNEIELLLLNAIKRKLIGARVDHRNGVIRFGHYDFDSANIGDQLSTLAIGMRKSLKMIDEERKEDTHAKAKREAYVKIINSLGDEHRRILARKEIIEKKKIYMEQQEALKRQHEAEVAAAAAAAKAERDQQLLKENLERAQAEVKPASSHSQFVNNTINAADKAKVEMAGKVAKLSKQIYYLERAYRHEEVPIINKLLEDKQNEDRRYFEEQQKEAVRLHHDSHQRALDEKKRLSKMVEEINSFTSKVIAKRNEQLPAARAEQEQRFQAFLIEQKAQSIERKERQKIEKKAAAERKIKEDEERRIKQEIEERERAEAEEKARLEQEEENKLWRKSPERRSPAYGGDRDRDSRERDFVSAADTESSWRRQEPVAPKRSEGAYVPPSRQQSGGFGGDRGGFNNRDAPRDTDNWKRDDAPPRRSEGAYVPPSRQQGSGGGFGPRDGGDRGFGGDRGGFNNRDAPRDGGDNWNRDAPRRDSGFGGERRDSGGFGGDRDAPRRDSGFGAPRGGGGGGFNRDAPRDGGDNWNRDAPRRDSGFGAPRGGGGFGQPRDGGGDNWRGGSNSPAPPKNNTKDDDGWTTVGKKK